MRAFSIIIGIFVIGLIVFIHEFGHFIIARKNHVNVPEFWIGFGPRLFSFKKGGTEFSLRPILFGGACVFDEIDTDDDDDYETEIALKHLPVEGLLHDQAPWVRLWVLFAGPLFNLLLGFICSMIVIGCAGIDFPTVASCMEGYPAEAAGLEAGDTITDINGTHIFTFRDLSMYLDDYNDGEELQVTFERDGEEHTVDIVPQYNEESSSYYIGISVSQIRTAADSGAQMLRYSLHEVSYWVRYTVHALKDLVTGHIAVTSLSGPVGVVSAVSDVVEESSQDGSYYVFLNLAYMVTILTVDIGVMNLLPIPGLDGGRILLVLAELVRGRRLPEKVENTVTIAGVMFLVLLMIFVFFKDVFDAIGFI